MGIGDLLWPNEPALNIGVKDFDNFLEWAYDVDASDIIMEAGEKLALKLHGEIVFVSEKEISSDELNRIIAKIYQPAAPTLLQDGNELNFKYQILRDDESVIRYRVNATSCQGGVTVENGVVMVIRTIPGTIPHHTDLQIQQELMDAVQAKTGIFFVTGPTGSGKSTSLAAMIQEIAQTKRSHIITFESPIEFDLKAIPNRKSVVVQSEVPQNLSNYRVATANSLRRAPDIILFGEGRDRETIAACILEAQTGHFVLTTLHTNNVAIAFTRMADEFDVMERKSTITKLIDTTKGIMHQRLYRKMDGGRVALREYLILDAKMRRHLHVQLAAGKDIAIEMDTLVKTKGVSLLSDAKEKFTQGIVDLDVYASIVAEMGTPADLECVPEIAANLLERKLINKNTHDIWIKEIEAIEEVVD